MRAGFCLGVAVGIAQPFPHGLERLERLAEPTQPLRSDRSQTTRPHDDHAQALQRQTYDHRLTKMGEMLGNFHAPLITVRASET